jgi:hypothetical protein
MSQLNYSITTTQQIEKRLASVKAENVSSRKFKPAAIDYNRHANMSQSQEDGQKSFDEVKGYKRLYTTSFQNRQIAFMKDKVSGDAFVFSLQLPVVFFHVAGIEDERLYEPARALQGAIEDV